MLFTCWRILRTNWLSSIDQCHFMQDLNPFQVLKWNISSTLGFTKDQLLIRYTIVKNLGGVSRTVIHLTSVWRTVENVLK